MGVGWGGGGCSDTTRECSSATAAPNGGADGGLLSEPFISKPRGNRRGFELLRTNCESFLSALTTEGR